MKLLALASLLFLLTATSFAFPSSYEHFGEICYDVNVTNTNTVHDAVWTLEGFCGQLSERKDVLELDGCVANKDGGLVWRKDGFFSDTCTNCVALEHQENVWLQCFCFNFEGQRASLAEFPMLDLNERISWDESGLHCNP